MQLLRGQIKQKNTKKKYFEFVRFSSLKKNRWLGSKSQITVLAMGRLIVQIPALIGNEKSHYFPMSLGFWGKV